jgi:hypothetical protein
VVDWDWSRVVFDHVKLGVSDVEASKRFYKTVLAALEIPPLWENERGAQFANLVVVGAAEPTVPLHIGFVARSRDEVDAFYRAGLVPPPRRGRDEPVTPFGVPGVSWKTQKRAHRCPNERNRGAPAKCLLISAFKGAKAAPWGSMMVPPPRRGRDEPVTLSESQACRGKAQTAMTAPKKEKYCARALFA